MPEYLHGTIVFFCLSYNIAKERKVSSMQHPVSPPVAALITAYAIGL